MVWIIVMCLSTVWSLILTAPIHCRGSIGEQVMECYISPNMMKKQKLILILDGLRVSKCFSKLKILGELQIQIQNVMLWLSLHVLSSADVFLLV